MTRNKKIVVALITIILAIALITIATLIINLNKENKVAFADNSSSILDTVDVDTNSQTLPDDVLSSYVHSSSSNIENDTTVSNITTSGTNIETQTSDTDNNIDSIFNSIINQLNSSELCSITNSDIQDDTLTLELEVTDKNAELGSIPAAYTVQYIDNSFEITAPECFSGYAGASIKKQLSALGSIEVIKAIEVSLTSQSLIENSEHFDDTGYLLDSFNYNLDGYSCKLSTIYKEIEDGSSTQLVYTINKNT